MIGRTRNDKIFDAINGFLLLILLLAVAYPLYFVVIASISSPTLVNSGEVLFYPKGLNFTGYTFVLQDEMLWHGYLVTIVLTVVGTIINLALTFTGAYALTKTHLPGIKVIMFLFTFTMFFSGGMIPTYLCISEMGLLNTIWAVVLPGAITANHVIIVRTFFQGIPRELTEAAAIDGCTNFKAFAHIVLPLSKAVVAVIALYVASSLWNGYFGPMIYLNDQDLYPLQLFLRQILLQNDMQGADISASSVQEEQYIAQLIRYGVMIVSTVPMMILYPFIQKYFVKGVMIGSVKG